MNSGTRQKIDIRVSLGQVWKLGNKMSMGEGGRRMVQAENLNYNSSWYRRRVNPMI